MISPKNYLDKVHSYYKGNNTNVNDVKYAIISIRILILYNKLNSPRQNPIVKTKQPVRYLVTSIWDAEEYKPHFFKRDFSTLIESSLAIIKL